MGPFGHTIPADNVAFADDLLVVTGSPANMQGIANVVSAFCRLTGLTLSVEKFRAFAVNWGHEKNLKPVEIQVFTNEWEPKSFTMATAGVMKHLGVHWDMSLDHETMYKQARDHSRAVCQLLSRKNATAECKKLCIELSVHKKIIYYAKYMNSSLEQFRKLDTPFNSLIRHITKNTKSYSNTMLYTPDKFGGIGFKRLSDEIQTQVGILTKAHDKTTGQFHYGWYSH
jgi:hypothetical protein